MMASNVDDQKTVKDKGKKSGGKNTKKRKCDQATNSREINEELENVTSTKERFTFFYGEKKSPFSQFRAVDFEVDGVKYSCAEQYMMHQKAVLFEDHEIAQEILQASKPMQMKSLGRKVSGFNELVWREHRRDIVKRGNIAKFSQNLDIRAELMATRGTTLVEASPRDTIWGVGLGQDNPKIFHKSMWRGQNLLGYILTEVREEFEKEEGQRN